jgi:hypothetical protein
LIADANTLQAGCLEEMKRQLPSLVPVLYCKPTGFVKDGHAGGYINVMYL